uniref:F-box/LRR-repeat protein 15/At3g58940/PEG3-like LRR domain-containing protein n=1 Tax=Oryza punctata TaxID=4537 RepID=A0A0E0MP89_ORYPU
MEEDRARIVASAVARFRLPQATQTHATPAAVLAPPIADFPHAEWRGLPDDAVARVLARLPVLDLFRLGYLFSPHWLDIWRAEPLYLHDRQFASPRIAAADVADAIANVLELHVGDGVQFVGVQGGGGSDDDGDGGGGNEVAGADGDDLGVIVNPWGRGGVVDNDDDDDDDGDDHDGGLDVAEDEASVEDAGVVDDSGPVVVAVEHEDRVHRAADQDGGEGKGVVARHLLRFPGGVGADDGVVSDDDLYGHDDIPDGGYEIGRVYSFRVETTRWRPDHLDRWCAALQRGRARHVTLANLAIEGHPDLPQGIRDCTSLKGLHVFFFTVEANHIDPLVKLRGLGVYGCTSNYGMIARALLPQSEIRKLTIDFSELGDVAVATTRLRSLMMYNNVVEGTVTVDDAIQFQNLYLYPTRPSRISIGEVPSLRTIGSIDLFNTILDIKGIMIQTGMVQHAPKMRSVRILGLRVNYTEMGDRVPREIEHILKCFPCLEELEIMRDDEVTEAEGLLEVDDEHIYAGNNFFHGLGCFGNHLRWIYLTTFRGGKRELALGKAILDEARAGTQFKIMFSPGSNTDNILNQLNLAFQNFRMATPNDAVRNGHRPTTTSQVAARRSPEAGENGPREHRRHRPVHLLFAAWNAPPPVANHPHADWRGLPDAAVSLVLDRLPVVDLFRLGYLFSPRWLLIWSSRPLYLHDHQFTTSPIPAANVANAITNVLHHHVGHGVQFVPVQGGGGQGEGVLVTSDDEEPDIYDDGIIRNGETTRWSLEHIGHWRAALQRGGVRVLMLANLAIPEQPELPQTILDCGTSLLGLHVFFFTVEAYHIDRFRVLGLYNCVWGLGMIERAIHREQKFRSWLRRIISLDLFNTVLEIQDIVIQAGMVDQPPQIRSVRHLGLRVNYTTMVDMVPRGIEQILKSFPRVKSLNILRDEEVTQAEGLLQWNDVHYDGNNFFHGLESFNYHLRWIYLTGFRGGKCEVALMKAMLDKARVLILLRMEYSPLPSSLPELTLNELDLSL